MKQIFALILTSLLFCGIIRPVALAADEPSGPSSSNTERPNDTVTPSAITLSHFDDVDPTTAQAFSLGTPQEDISNWFTDLTYFVGYDALGNYYTDLMLTWSFDGVDTSTPGVYHISVTPELGETYTLADEVFLPLQPYIISIQTPGQLDINCYMPTGRGALRFPWMFSPEQSKQLNQLEQLGQQDTFAATWLRQDKAEWIQLSDGFIFSSDAFYLYPHILEMGSTYDLQVDYFDGQTGILTFQYDEKISIIHYVGGDRDGGDVNGGNSPTDSQPAPTFPQTPSYPQNRNQPSINHHIPVQNNPSTLLDKIPWLSFFTFKKDQEKQPSISSQPQEKEDFILDQVEPDRALNSAPDKADHVAPSGEPANTDIQPDTTSQLLKATPTVQESYSPEETVISGLRLRNLCIDEENVVFGSGNLTVSIPSKLLLTLNLSDFDTLSVKLKQSQNNQIIFAVKISDKSLTELSGTVVRMPYIPQFQNVKITVCNELGEIITDATFDGEFLRFAADKAGSYTFFETQAGQDSKKGMSPLVPLSGGLILATGGFAFFRWKRYE